MTLTAPALRTLPSSAIAEIERVLGDQAHTFATAPGYSSVDVVGTVSGRQGHQLFIKAVSWTSPAAADYRIEAKVSAVLPRAVPTPPLLLSFDQHGWVLLGFEAVAGRPPHEPWQADELEAALDALRLTASALAHAPAVHVPTIGERMSGRSITWRTLLGQGRCGAVRASQLDPWEKRHLTRLARAEERWEAGVVGPALVHFDLRHDNFLITSSGSPVIIDWGRASRGQAWVDLVCLLLESDLGPLDPELVFAGHELGRGARRGAVDGLLVALAGYWTRAAAEPVTSATAQLRLRQEHSRRATVRWLEHRWS